MCQLLRKICNNKVMRAAYLAWLSVALFYFYQYILRVAPGVMVDQLVNEFHIRAEEFATLGFLDAFAYAVMQIPLGIIVDRVGVKRTVMVSIVLCIVGALLFGIATHFWMVQVSRLLTGVGSAAAFMCALKTIADHFPPGKRGVLMGMTLTIGMCGALLAGKNTMLVIEAYDWRHVFYYSAGMGMLVMLLLHYFVDEKAHAHKVRSSIDLKTLCSSLVKIFKNHNIIIYAILAIGLYVPLSVVADLWGTAFMQQKFGFSQAEGAHLSSLLYLGLGVGSILLPWITERFNILNAGILCCGVGILSLFSLLVYGPELSYNELSILLVMLGFFCGAEMMCFTGALLFSDEDNSGEVIGVVNTFNMLGGAFLKYGVGLSLDATWDGALQESGVRYYSTEQYTQALSALTVVLVLCCLISLLLLRKKSNRG